MRKRKIILALALTAVLISSVFAVTYYFWSRQWHIPWLKPKGEEGVAFEIVKDFDVPARMTVPNTVNITWENVDIDDYDDSDCLWTYEVSANFSITGKSDAFSPDMVTVRWQTWRNGTCIDDFILELTDEGATLRWFGDHRFYAGCYEDDYKGYYLITVLINDQAKQGVYTIDLEFTGEAVFAC